MWRDAEHPHFPFHDPYWVYTRESVSYDCHKLYTAETTFLHWIKMLSKQMFLFGMGGITLVIFKWLNLPGKQIRTCSARCTLTEIPVRGEKSFSNDTIIHCLHYSFTARVTLCGRSQNCPSAKCQKLWSHGVCMSGRVKTSSLNHGSSTAPTA